MTFLRSCLSDAGLRTPLKMSIYVYALVRTNLRAYCAPAQQCSLETTVYIVFNIFFIILFINLFIPMQYFVWHEIEFSL